MNENETYSINKEAKLLFKNIFFNRQIQLESTSKEKIVFSKQAEIKKLQDRIERFIERRPNGQFEIRVLEKNAETIEEFKFALVVKNYKNEDRKPKLWYVVIHNAFDDVEYYLVGVNGIIIPEDE